MWKDTGVHTLSDKAAYVKKRDAFIIVHAIAQLSGARSNRNGK
jgi:hypothetical protein